MPTIWGRGETLERILAKLSKIRDDNGAIIVIEGSLGSGKTRLLTEIRKELEEFAVFELSSEGSELDRATAFGYLISVFGSASPEFGHDDAGSSFANPHLAREWLCRKVLDAMGGPGGRTKVAVLLDDLHWADGSSIVALHLALSWLTTNPVLLVATWNTSRPDLRDEQLFKETNSRANNFIKTLREKSAEHVVISALSQEDSIGMARELMPFDLPPEAIDLVGRAGGNPQLIVALTQGWLTEGTAGSGRIPDYFHEIVRHHIDSLHPTTSTMLRIAAFIGMDFSLSQLKEKMEVDSVQDEIALIRSIHDAKRAGLLRLEQGRIVFKNPLVWQSLAEGGGLLVPDRGMDSSEPEAEEQHKDSQAAAREHEGTPAALANMSRVQLEIAQLTSQGKTNRQIARQLFISPHTVDTHLRRIFKKLDINSRVELVRIFLTQEQ
jgi:DNA-binding CsgD family transcriptional regulator